MGPGETDCWLKKGSLADDNEMAMRGDIFSSLYLERWFGTYMLATELKGFDRLKSGNSWKDHLRSKSSEGYQRKAQGKAQEGQHLLFLPF